MAYETVRVEKNTNNHQFSKSRALATKAWNLQKPSDAQNVELPYESYDMTYMLSTCWFP